MLSIGLLSFLQITFLPGFIACRIIRIRSFLRTMIFSFAISQTFNYLFVFITTSLGIYYRELVFVIFGLEVLFLVYLFRSILFIPINKLIQSAQFPKLHSFSYSSSEENSIWNRIYHYLIIAFFGISIVLACVSILYFINAFINQIGLPFEVWDAVVSWDRWAFDWFNNRLPRLTWNYPQLIPANWSITYKFMGTDSVKWIAKSSMWLFEVYSLALLFDLGIVTKRIEYFWATFFCAFLLWHLGSQGSGYADTPTTFFALLSFYCLLSAKQTTSYPQVKQNLLLGALFAASSAATKQAGLFYAFVYPVLVILLLPKSLLQQIRAEWKKYLKWGGLSYIAIFGIWDIFNLIMIKLGANQSEVSTLLFSIHQHRTFPERFAFGLNHLQPILTIPLTSSITIDGAIIMWVFFILILVSFQQEVARKSVLVLVFPYMLIWGFLFSYDHRNIVLLIPFVSISAGFGIIELFILLRKILIRPISLILLLVIGLFMLPFFVSDKYVLEQAHIRQIQIGAPKVNEQLYEYYQTYGLEGKIQTDYQFLGSLPELKEFYILAHSNSDSFITSSYRTGVTYVLIYKGWATSNVWDYYNNLINQGVAHEIFETDNYRFIKIK